MALQSFTITIGALTDTGNNGKNYVNNQPVYIKRTNGTLASIYRDLAGVSQITQDGLSNVTNSKGQFTFFIEAGDYNAEYQSQVTPITVVGPDYFNNRIDETVNQIILDLSTSRGFRVKGTFAAGFTYELPNDVGLDASGNAWIYTDTDALPFTVPAATSPSFPTYTQVTFSDHNNLSNRNAVGAHDNIYVRAVTLSEAIAEDAPEGTRYKITDLGGSRYDVVESSDAGGYYIEGLASGRKLRIVDSVTINPSRNNFLSQQDWIDYCVTNKKIPAYNAIFDNQNTWTVGIGGDFSTISDAINFLYSAYSPFRELEVSNKRLARQEIRLLSGFIMQEQVFIEGGDYSHIEITSVDSEVVIDRSFLTQAVGESVLRYMAFNFRYGCISPIMSVLFNMNANGTATERGGCRVEAGSYAYWSTGAGIKNVPGRGLHLVNSKAWANNTIFSGAGGRGCRVGNLSHLWGEGMDVTNCGESGFAFDTCSTAIVREADCSGAGVYGLLNTGADVDAEGLTANNCGTNGILLERGAKQRAQNSTVTGCGTNGISSSANVSVTDGSVFIGKLGNYSNSNFGNNIFVRNGSAVDIHGSTLTGAFGNGLEVQSGSNVDASDIVATGAGNRGCLANGADVTLIGADISGAGGAADLLISNGSVVKFSNGTGTFGGTANTVTASGIIFQ